MFGLLTACSWQRLYRQCHTQGLYIGVPHPGALHRSATPRGSTSECHTLGGWIPCTTPTHRYPTNPGALHRSATPRGSTSECHTQGLHRSATPRGSTSECHTLGGWIPCTTHRYPTNPGALHRSATPRGSTSECHTQGLYIGVPHPWWMDPMHYPHTQISH